MNQAIDQSNQSINQSWLTVQLQPDRPGRCFRIWSAPQNSFDTTRGQCQCSADSRASPVKGEFLSWCLPGAPVECQAKKWWWSSGKYSGSMSELVKPQILPVIPSVENWNWPFRKTPFPCPPWWAICQTPGTHECSWESDWNVRNGRWLTWTGKAWLIDWPPARWRLAAEFSPREFSSRWTENGPRASRDSSRKIHRSDTC